MKYSVKLLCAALICAAVLPMAAACGSQKPDPASPAAGITSAAAETTTAELRPELPDKDYDGYEFKVLISGNTENGREKNDFDAPEITGEPVNDARYQRNAAVSEKYNIKITNTEEYGSDAGEKKLKSSVLAGDGAYDIAMLGGYACCKLAYDGYLFDIASLPYIDLTQPWWDQKANDDLMIKGRMFYSTGDISTADNDATQAILFSKSLVEAFKLDDPYAMVKDGSWTMDNFIRLAGSVSSDLNGDGTFDMNDRYGALIWDDTLMGVYNSTGDKCATVNAEGQIELTFYTQRALAMFEKFAAFAFDKTQSYAYQRVSYSLDDPINMFSNDQALFFMQLLDLVTYFRDMKNDFGILPYPKFDEAQQEY
ncbi:MAG: hypothetical protein WCQ72_06635, partial [Eubacteriales bacterium]